MCNPLYVETLSTFGSCLSLAALDQSISLDHFGTQDADHNWHSAEWQMMHIEPSRFLFLFVLLILCRIEF